MPLLGKEEFSLKSLPPNVDLNTEVFYCSITGEAFLTYDEYFERQILCSSLLWTCSVTGKTNLTYLDALKSERQSQNILSSVPRVLQKVILHLMKYINNFSTNIALAVLFEYTNMRYFIGETIQILSKTKTGKRGKGIIRDVIPPAEYDPATSISYGLDPLSYQYVVEVVDARNGENVVEVMAPSRICRSKFSLTREKLRLFLKQHLSSKSSRYDTLSIKEESVQKFGLDHLQWEHIFKGPTPNFNDDTTVLKAFNKRSSNNGEVVVYSTLKGDPEVANPTEEEVQAIQMVKKKSNLLKAQKEKQIKRVEKAREKGVASYGEEKASGKKKRKKQKLKAEAKGKGAKTKGKKKGGKGSAPEPEEPKEDKEAERKKLREARRKFEEDLRVWMEKRDDLLCDDLKPLPAPTPVDCDIDISHFGDSLLVLEFINVFQEYINDFSNVFPAGISIELFSRILNDSEVGGPYGDLLLMLLDTVLMTNRDYDAYTEGDLKINDANNDDFVNFATEDEDTSNFCSNNFSNHWVTTFFGTREQLAKLKMDVFTLSEILRIYLLKARSADTKKIRHNDDEDIALAIKLTTSNVFELDQSDRLSLLKLLLDDFVKIPAIRRKIEESMEEISGLKTQIRHLNAAFTKWLRDQPIRLRIRKKKPATAAEGANNKEEAVAEEPQEIEASEEEKEQYKKEKNQREQQMKKSISELKAKIRKLSAYCRPRPLGIDRAFRRYWVFQSVSGLLVEHSIEERPCLENAAPMEKPLLSDYSPNARRRKSKKMKRDEAAAAAAAAAAAEAGNDAEQISATSPSDEHLFDRCTGDHSTCSIHGTVNAEKRIRWAFYTKEQLDELIESLSTRGHRELDLKNSLIIEKNSILKHHLEPFAPVALNPNYMPPMVYEVVDPNDDSNGLVRKSERIQNQNHEKVTQGPKSTESAARHVKTEQTKYSSHPPTEAHELELADQLLVMEDRIFNSCFTSFKLEDRDHWWASVTANGSGDKVKSIRTLTPLFRTLAKSLRPFCLLPPLSTLSDSSAASSPSDKENIEHIQPKVPKLSDKWLDLLKMADGLETGQLNDFESSYGISNLSQIFLNMYILEKSINWDLSAMKTATKCRICRRKANDEMILCDMCNRGYHIYCLKPPINSIDDIEGDWFCYSCVPNGEPPTTSRRNLPQRRSNGIDYTEEAQVVVEEEQHSFTKPEKLQKSETEHVTMEQSRVNPSDVICRVCKDDLYDKYAEVSCKTCNRGYHLHCVNLSRVPRSWSCLRCEVKERYNSVTHNANIGENGEVRRSSRKRRPNHYYDDDLDAEESHYSSKSRRYSIEDRG